MLKKIINPLVIFFFLATNQSFSFEKGNDGVGSILPKTSIAKPPKKISLYNSAEKKIIKAIKLERKGKNKKAEKLYFEALEKLFEANKSNPFNPNILNYLGFINIKINKFEDAEIYYVMGLEIDPNHIAMNEYLGELYVMTDRIDLAKERLEVLAECNCKEYFELKEIISAKKN